MIISCALTQTCSQFLSVSAVLSSGDPTPIPRVSCSGVYPQIRDVSEFTRSLLITLTYKYIVVEFRPLAWLMFITRVRLVTIF